MFMVGSCTFEADKGQSIHNFSEELCKLYDRLGRNIVGVFNDVRLDVNQYENPMSLYWQYEYKNKMRSS